MNKKKVIIIEDDIDLLAIISDHCKRIDCLTYEFHTFEDFIYKFKDLKPDLIITDLNLPGLSGHAVIKSIRAQSEDIPIVMITGVLEESVNIEALTLGANDFITKPFNFEVLLLKIKKFLKLTLNSKKKEMVFLPEQRVIKKDRLVISLTEVENRIFEILFNTDDNFASRDQLHNENKGRSLDVHITTLRKKISPLNLEINSVRSKGYRLKQID
jgi:DNA-binding response OmpR family regulator